MQRTGVSICVLAASLCAPIATSAGAAQGTDYPTKPIRIIVPFPPGGSNDLLGRYLGERLSDRLGQQIVIDNRGGANGILGTQLAAGTTPDGYTLLLVSVSYAMNAAVRKLPWDVEKSFDPIAMIGTNTNCLVVSPTGPYKTLKDIIAAAKATPGALSYASTGVGGFNHFGGELFNKLAGVSVVHVPYKGGAPGMTDVMGGQIPMMFSSLTQTLPHVRSGRLHVIAVGSEKRQPAAPEAPTFIEAGLPGYSIYGWWGMVVPAGVPKAVQSKLAALFTQILQEPTTQKRLAAEAAEPQIMTPDELRAFIGAEVKKWTEVAKQAGIRVN
jgi:tripartite-type tricarboxylate transporter receptor subunit TctC